MAFCAETLPLIEMVYVDATFTRMCPSDNMKTRPLTFPIHIAINNNYQYHSMEWICNIYGASGFRMGSLKG